MKKKIYLLFAAVTMLLAVTSCSQEEDFAQQSSNGVTSFSISLNDEVGSRAIGDGTSVNKLYYQVFMKVGDELKKVTEVLSPEGNFVSGQKLDIPLLNGETYDIVFWAQNSNCSIYGVDDEDGMKTISVNYNNVSANQESYDAFYHALVGFEADGNNHKVKLTRPFAQLNLGTDDWSKVIVPTGTVPVTKTSVKVKGLADKFNPLTGDAIESQTEQEFKYSAIPTYTKNNGTVDETVNEKFTVNGKEYTYLSLNYLLVPSQVNNEKATVDLTFNLQYGDEGNEKTLQPISVPNVPLQRNWRTNIIGSLLTGTNFDIVVDPNPEGTENWEVTKVSSQSEIQEAIDNAEAGTPTYLEVTDNITFGVDSKALSRAAETSYISIPAGKNVVLDLKGFTISGIEKEGETGSFSLIKNQGTLTITNSAEQEGKLVFEAKNNRGWNAYSSVVSNTVGGNLTVESGVVIEHKGGTDMAYGIDNLTNGKGTSAITTINGATVKSTYIAIRQFLNGIEATNELYVKSGTLEGGKRSIWMQDPSANSNTGKLVVESSENVKLTGVVKLSMTEGSTEWPLDITIPASVIDEDSKLEYPENLPVGYSVKEIDGVYTVVVTHVAKVGEVGYTTLKKAVDAVEDGGTITLVANETFSENNRSSNSGYWDGLSYSGDKSFTIDLGGYTISQDGALNDYLIWIKNDGAKANTINLKNGTLDAGKTAYSALATASSNKQKITINLEDVNLINNISNGAVVKARGGSELNVKAGTKITAVDSYTGIEAVGNNTVVNIYDGAEIYQNGTSSYVGAIVGASYNATMNIYGGKGQSAKCGIIVMSTGATINVSGGEWIANNDGTVAVGNQGVLVSQNNRNEKSWACKSVLNVTGGTFKGGYDCWGMGPGQEADDAQINIKGGNFNADPTSYLVEGFKIQEGTTYNVVVEPVAMIGSTEYATLQEAIANAKSGETVTLQKNVTLSEELQLPAGITFNGNGKQINGTIYAGGDLTFAGHTKVTSFSASYYNRTITIGEGACLEVTGTGRVTLGYGNTFNITGSITEAKTADKTTIQPSLIIPGGISITGANDAAFNVTNAYVKIGNTSSKNSAANGVFTLNFDNSIAEFTNQFTLSEPTGGNNPTFNMNIKNSVFTTSAKLCVAAPNSKVVIDNSTVTLGSYIRNSGEFTLKNGSVLTGATIQFGENGGNDGTITVDNSTLTIDASSTGHAFDGKGVGSIVLKNGANASVTYYKAMTITTDETSNFTGEEVK